MKSIKNGVTIDTKVMWRGWELVKISDGQSSEKITITDKGIELLEQFLSDPAPEEDTRKWHYETVGWVEDMRNYRYFCRKCQKQSFCGDGDKKCEICGSELSDIFNYENKIYD